MEWRAKETLYQGKHTNHWQAHEKILIIAYRQASTNHNDKIALLSVRMASIQKASAGERCWEKEILFMVIGNVYWSGLYGKWYGDLFKN